MQRQEYKSMSNHTIRTMNRIHAFQVSDALVP